MKIVSIVAGILCLASVGFKQHIGAIDRTNSSDSSLVLPAGGNTWIKGVAGKKGMISDKGITNWSDKSVSFDTYFRTAATGNMQLGIKAKADGETKLSVTIDGQRKTVDIKAGGFRLYTIGSFQLKDTGYHSIQLSGISKTGQQFAAVDGYTLSGSAIDSKTDFVKTNDGNFFYWGRRGPSVHLNYPFADSIQASYFYNEITVPVGQDVIGSYYMANGFGEGYFGIQVNSEKERRILFSVWSPFTTDDPKNIPDSMRIVLLKKGADVHAGEFGNEGSGGQSYLRYPWKAGVTYKFLLKGEPDAQQHTTYTAWFFAPEKNEWMLIASFKRPQTNTYLKRFHSFLENFIPEQGNIERKVLFGNQWICDVNGNWISLHKAVFTYDNTAAKGYRKDYAGGAENDHFFLKNCGFFNNYTPYKKSFERNATSQKPVIDIAALP